MHPLEIVCVVLGGIACVACCLNIRPAAGNGPEKIDFDSPREAAHRDWERQHGVIWSDVRRRLGRTMYGISMSSQHGGEGSNDTSPLRTSIIDSSSSGRGSKDFGQYSRAGRYVKRTN